MTDTIFMIHGMWGGSWLWDNYKKIYEEAGFNCVTTTLRFHDMDPKADPNSKLGTTGLLDYIDDLEQEIKQLDVTPIIVGHSMGGLLAQILGSRGVAKALVLLTPASPAGILALTPSVIRSFWSIQTKWGFWNRPVRQTFNEAAFSILNLLPPDEQKKAFEKFVYESGRAAYEIGYWLIDSTGASKVDESQITCPILVIGSAKDRITPASVVRKVAKKYNSVSTYKEFDNHAHWVLAEPGWQEVAEFTTDWMKKVLP
ncbi:MAG: alpha/beta hydrolase [Desulfamplus sp.]|nr:alpha/beta hydrolase [Desulfamplus sp.]